MQQRIIIVMWLCAWQEWHPDDAGVSDVTTAECAPGLELWFIMVPGLLARISVSKTVG